MSNEYKLNEAEAQARYDQFAESLDAADLSADLALARLLTEQAASKSPHLAASLLACVARLAAAHDTREYRRGEMLAKAVVLKLALELVDSVILEFRDVCPDWQERIERVAARVTGVIEAADNPRIKGPSNA